jgi:hypothetical protein
MCSGDLNIGTTSDMTHIKIIFSFSPGNVKRFIGKTLCSSDDSVTQLIHILQFFTIKMLFISPLPRRKNLEESNFEKDGAWEWAKTALGHVPLEIIF